MMHGNTTAKIYTDEWPHYSAIVCQILSPKLSDVSISYNIVYIQKLIQSSILSDSNALPHYEFYV